MVDLMWEIWFTINGLWVSLGGPGSTLWNRMHDGGRGLYMKKGRRSLGSEQWGYGWGRHEAVPLTRWEHASSPEVGIYVDLLRFRCRWTCTLMVTLIDLGFM